MEKRNTKQKAAIREAFVAADRPLSPDEAHSGAQQNYPGLGTATVYRNIQALVDEGWLQMVVVPAILPGMKSPARSITTISNAMGAASSTNWRAVFRPLSQNCRVDSASLAMSSFCMESARPAAPMRPGIAEKRWVDSLAVMSLRKRALDF